jgi:hypothetical protein
MMLKLDLILAPRWVEVAPGVRLHCAPCTSSVLAEARGAPDVMAASEMGNPILVSHLFSRHVARLVVVAWEGVGDAEGNPVVPTAEYVQALFERHQPIAERFAIEFLGPVLTMESEKNGSAVSPNGTSAAGRNTAPTAAHLARTARAGSTGRKRSKGGKSGT